MKTPYQQNVSDPLDYAQLDANIVPLVKELNSFDGVKTIGSCGGHAEPGLHQWAEGTWYVEFELPRSPRGWHLLELLSWAINTSCRNADEWDVVLLPIAPQPFLADPGECLTFVIEGRNGEDPSDLARYLERVRLDTPV